MLRSNRIDPQTTSIIGATFKSPHTYSSNFEIPSLPLLPQYVLDHFAHQLTEHERLEILNYNEIYYWGQGIFENGTEKVGGYLNNTLNHGYDNSKGDYQVTLRDHFAFRYEIIESLGKGSFGVVLKCFDHKSKEHVAVKIIRNKKRFTTQGEMEVKILKEVKRWDPDDKCNIISMTDNFRFRNHLCIVFELLSINLYEFIKSNEFKGFSLGLIRRFTTQILQSLCLLWKNKVIHCDLKPENILLKCPKKSSIKVIDFGSSCLHNEKVYTYIQSRFYRSPEVILGLDYSMSIDIWSLGCILAELFTGTPIFPGESEHEQLACIMEVFGVPDNYLLNRSERKGQFFDSSYTPLPHLNSKGKRRYPNTKTLPEVLKIKDESFLDFVRKCFIWDPDKRMTPMEAMQHPWIQGLLPRSVSSYSITSSRSILSLPSTHVKKRQTSQQSASSNSKSSIPSPSCNITNSPHKPRKLPPIPSVSCNISRATFFTSSSSNGFSSQNQLKSCSESSSSSVRGIMDSFISTVGQVIGMDANRSNLPVPYIKSTSRKYA